MSAEPIHRIKPPLGPKPRYLADWGRCKELAEAIQRFLEAGYTPHSEWAEELLEIAHRLETSEVKEGAQP